MKTTINGWLARDLYPDKLQIFEKEPKREGMRWEYGYFRAELPKDMLQEITWKDSPRKVTIIIKAE